jgi:hypothetical protein
VAGQTDTADHDALEATRAIDCSNGASIDASTPS